MSQATWGNAPVPFSISENIERENVHFSGGKVVRGLASYDDDYYHYYDSYYYDWTWPGMFWTGVVACNGSEAALDNCSFSGWGPDNCDFTDSVGVECYIDDTVTPPGNT